MFVIRFLDYAKKKAEKLIKNNAEIQERLNVCLINLKNNPFDLSLKTHKVRSKLFGIKYSSSVTGDIRIIWDFDEENEEIKVLEVYDIGGHSGNKSVY